MALSAVASLVLIGCVAPAMATYSLQTEDCTGLQISCRVMGVVSRIGGLLPGYGEYQAPTTGLSLCGTGTGTGTTGTACAQQAAALAAAQAAVRCGPSVQCNGAVATTQLGGCVAATVVQTRTVEVTSTTVVAGYTGGMTFTQTETVFAQVPAVTVTAARMEYPETVTATTTLVSAVYVTATVTETDLEFTTWQTTVTVAVTETALLTTTMVNMQTEYMTVTSVSTYELPYPTTIYSTEVIDHTVTSTQIDWRTQTEMQILTQVEVMTAIEYRTDTSTYTYTSVYTSVTMLATTEVHTQTQYITATQTATDIRYLTSTTTAIIPTTIYCTETRYSTVAGPATTVTNTVIQTVCAPGCGLSQAQVTQAQPCAAGWTGSGCTTACTSANCVPVQAVQVPCSGSGSGSGCVQLTPCSGTACNK